jgi:outer membrane protein TolC
MPVTALLLVCLVVGPSWAQDEPRRYSLQELVEAALRHNSQIEESQWRVAGASSRLRQARAARILPRLRLESLGGLVPSAAGDVFHPPHDTTGWRDLGPFVRAELEFAQPLYTFGQLASLEQAASAGVQVEEADLAMTRLDVALEVKGLYYGLLLAQDLHEMVGDLAGKLRKRKDEVEGNAAVPLSGHYKLELALVELDKEERGLARKRDLARAALAWKAGLPGEQTLEMQASDLEPVTAVVPPLDTLFAQATRRRPDWRKLQSGLTARRALLDAAQSAYYPQVFLAGGVRYAVAPDRTDQHNPFVKDDFNYLNFGAVLGVRQSFEWGLLGADRDRSRAEYLQLRATERVALSGIRLDLQRAHGEFRQAEDALASAEAARKLSRQWVRLAEEEYDLDPGEVKELITAVEAWARNEQGYCEAIHQYNLSLARLEQTAGGPPLSQQP